MKRKIGKSISFITALTMCASIIAPANVVKAEGATGSTSLVGDIAVEHFKGDDGTSDINNFVKISHPRKPASKMEFDPKKDEETRKKHQNEVFIDGVVDYLGDEVVGEPSLLEGADTPGDRGESYSWAGFAYGDWMYVSTLFNSTESTGRLLGEPVDPEQLDKSYGGDLFTKEPDDTSTGGTPDKVSGSTLTKINVKTGETKIIMSKSKNGIEPSFRNAVEYHDKLYFCGSVNHLPAIYEVDPKTDAFQCVYQDPSIRNHPGGPGAAYQESLAKEICPTIRGLTVFKDYLVISTVGTDGNPYIAVSQDPTAGFTTIAKTWEDVDNKIPGELLGYPACKIPDSIMGGSIWEMVEFNGSLYVAICTGTPDNAPTSHTVKDNEGNEKKIIDTMQSFALIRGDFNEGTEESPNKVSDAGAWTWTPVIGDTQKDGARYTFGIDPERTRASACNMVVYNDHLYIGEYNDTQIAFKNMVNAEMNYLAGNLDQSVSLYRMDKDENIEKVMGDPTEMFPTSLSGIDESGFGRRENQYIWQTKVFDGKLYIGTFDETMILTPLAQMAADMSNANNKQLEEKLDVLNSEIDSLASVETKEAGNETSTYTNDKEDEIPSEDISNDSDIEDILENEVSDNITTEGNNDDVAFAKKLLDIRNTYETKKEAGLLSDIVAVDDENPYVLLPSSYYDAEPSVNVETPEDLYLALLTLKDLFNGENNYSTKEQLAAFVQYEKLYDEIVSYKNSLDSALPQMMNDSVALFDESTEQRTQIKDLSGVIQYMKDAISGFDMYVTEDGINFEQITRTGMNDPYNQGLRVFAANDDPENSWMCIGSANPFYGTQIWRMDDGIDVNEHDEKQIRVKINFVDKQGKEIPRQADKAGEIYVVESQKTIIPEDISIMVPENQQLKNPEKPVDIVYNEETNTYSAEIELASKYIDVQVRFVDSDKPESSNLISTAPIQTLKSNTTLKINQIESLMPSGYIIADEKAPINIVKNTEGEDITYSATIPVKRAYTINVISGDASTYKTTAGTTVTIKAEKRLGQDFVNWTSDDGIEFADATSLETTFVMPANSVTVTANYKEAAITYPVTVKNGNGSGRYEEGTEVSISADIPEGKVFDCWETKNGVEFADKNSSETTFIMPSYGVTVTAKFREPLPYYDVVVEGGEGSGSYEHKSNVTIKANIPDGKVFDKWISNDNITFENEYSKETTFKMPASSVTVKATFKDAPKPGWLFENNNWYYYDNNLNKLTGWQPINGDWFYFYEDGHMASDEFINNCYLNKNGYMVYGWQYIDNKWYYFKASGFMATGWFKDSNNNWFYFYEDGHMAAGEFVNNCYLNNSGYMVYGWQFIDGTWYYFKPSGYAATGWYKVNGLWYYFNNKGEMQTGMSPDGYLLSASGAMPVNSWVLYDNEWYYADNSGRPVKNTWKWIGGYCYYFYEDGHMASDEITPDGYFVNKDGHWLQEKGKAGRIRTAVYNLFN